MNVMVLGALGWLGGRFADYMREQGNITFYGGTSATMNINDRQYLPPGLDWVVNFAAKASVDWCEAHKVETFRSNVLGALNIAKLASEAGVRHAFISSGDLWGSYPTSEWRFETDPPLPAGFYNESKYMAEQLVREIDPNTLIVRLRLPISGQRHPRNFLDKLASYDRIVDSPETMTVVEDFLPALHALLARGAAGVRHLVNEGKTSPAFVASMMGLEFRPVQNWQLNERMMQTGRRARRGVLLATSYDYLPPIQERIGEVVRQWRS